MLQSQHYAIYSALYHLLRHLHLDVYAQWLLQNLQHSGHSDQMGGLDTRDTRCRSYAGYAKTSLRLNYRSTDHQKMC